MRNNQGKREDQFWSYEKLSAIGFFVFSIILLILSIFF